MSFSRSRSLFHEWAPLFSKHRGKVPHPFRLGAQFAPAVACSTVHIGRRSNMWNEHGWNPWTYKSRWGWGRDSAHWNTSSNGVRPAIDMMEKGDAYVIDADLPGVKKGELSVSVGDDGWSLIVEGRRSTAAGYGEMLKDAQEVKPGKGETEALVSERANTFTRKVWFSQTIDGRGVTAKLEDGVLRVHVPKKMSGDGSVRVDIA